MKVSEREFNSKPHVEARACKCTSYYCTANGVNSNLAHA
jgi:hypothetical protein